MASSNTMAQKNVAIVAVVALSLALLVIIIILSSHRNRLEGALIFTQEPETTRCFADHQKARMTFRDDDVINPIFSYPINMENACTVSDVEVVMTVNSAITNFNRRSRTRKFKQGRFAINKPNKAVMLFFVGLPSDKLANPMEFQAQLQNESAIYGDVIQINVIETYHNVVYKAIAVLQWINTYCNKTEFVLKMDDDVTIDPTLMLMVLYKHKLTYTDFLVGELRLNRHPNRTEIIKWHVSYEEYPFSTFPPFVPGPIMGYPITTAYMLYNQALRTRTLWLDDVFISGICTQKLGIPVLHDDNFKHVHKPIATANFVYE